MESTGKPRFAPQFDPTDPGWKLTVNTFGDACFRYNPSADIDFRKRMKEIEEEERLRENLRESRRHMR